MNLIDIAIKKLEDGEGGEFSLSVILDYVKRKREEEKLIEGTAYNSIIIAKVKNLKKIAGELERLLK